MSPLSDMTNPFKYFSTFRQNAIPAQAHLELETHLERWKGKLLGKIQSL